MSDALARQFPMHPIHRVVLKSIPWSLIAPHEQQAQANHGQMLERLAERGGLAADEALAILEDRRYRKMLIDDAERVIVSLLVDRLSLVEQEKAADREARANLEGENDDLRNALVLERRYRMQDGASHIDEQGVLFKRAKAAEARCHALEGQLKEILADAMTAYSDPYAPAVAYRAALMVIYHEGQAALSAPTPEAP